MERKAPEETFLSGKKRNLLDLYENVDGNESFIGKGAFGMVHIMIQKST